MGSDPSENVCAVNNSRWETFHLQCSSKGQRPVHPGSQTPSMYTYVHTYCSTTLGLTTSWVNPSNTPSTPFLGEIHVVQPLQIADSGLCCSQLYRVSKVCKLVIQSLCFQMDMAFSLWGLQQYPSRMSSRMIQKNLHEQHLCKRQRAIGLCLVYILEKTICYNCWSLSAQCSRCQHWSTVYFGV